METNEVENVSTLRIRWELYKHNARRLLRWYWNLPWYTKVLDLAFDALVVAFIYTYLV